MDERQAFEDWVQTLTGDVAPPVSWLWLAWQARAALVQEEISQACREERREAGY